MHKINFHKLPEISINCQKYIYKYPRAIIPGTYPIFNDSFYLWTILGINFTLVEGCTNIVMCVWINFLFAQLVLLSHNLIINVHIHGVQYFSVKLYNINNIIEFFINDSYHENKNRVAIHNVLVKLFLPLTIK